MAWTRTDAGGFSYNEGSLNFTRRWSAFPIQMATACPTKYQPQKRPRIQNQSDDETEIADFTII